MFRRRGIDAVVRGRSLTATSALKSVSTTIRDVHRIASDLRHSSSLSPYLSIALEDQGWLLNGPIFHHVSVPLPTTYRELRGAMTTTRQVAVAAVADQPHSLLHVRHVADGLSRGGQASQLRIAGRPLAIGLEM